MTGADVKLFVKGALSCRHQELSQIQLEEILYALALGLDKRDRMTNQAREDQFVREI